MNDIILTNDQLVSKVQENSKDIAILKSNTKWLYKYGGVGGKGNGSSQTSDPIITANINGLYAVENGKDVTLNGTGNYKLNISVSKANGKSFRIFGSYAPIKEGDGRPGTLGTQIVSFEKGYTVSYNITIPYNMNVSFTVDSGGDGDFTKQITFSCIAIPYVFNISFLKNNNVEHILDNGALSLSDIKSSGLKIKFDYSFYIKCTASYVINQNFMIQSDNLSGNFDLTQEKEGSIIFDVPVNNYSEINAGQYQFLANIKVTPDKSETISLDPIVKSCFIIPQSLFLMVYPENENNHLYYNARNTYYSKEVYTEYNDLINKEANQTITDEEKVRLNVIKQNITFSNNGIMGMILKGYYGTKNGKTFTITKITITDENNNESNIIIDYNTIYEQTSYTITPNISYTGELKLTFGLSYNGNESLFTYYLYCVNPISSFDWVPNHIKTNYQYYYRGGETKGNFYNSGLSTVDLNSNLDDYITLCKISHDSLGNKFDVLINIGFQYNTINDISKLLFDIYSDAESKTPSQHIYIYQNVAKYNGQDNLGIYLPQEHEFNKLIGSKYHLLSIHRHLISNNASEVDIYIDGSLEATFSSYVTENLNFNNIDCYPANYSINLAEIIYIPRATDSDSHNYFDDVSISQYWYKYCQVFRNNVGYDKKSILLLPALYKLSEAENLSNNNFNLSLETINNIASNIDCPVLMFTIDCASQLNNKSFKTSWFTLSNTTLRQLQVKNVSWSKGLSNVSLVNISSNYNWFIDIQGTSSLARKVKNLTLFTEPSESNYPNRLLFSPNFNMEDKNSFLPEEQFNLKADIVDSSHANNTSIGQFVNEHTTPFGDAEQQNAYAGHIKNCLTGFPVLLFIDEVIKNNSGEETHTYYYYGIFNFDLGRESYYNLGYKSTEVFDNESFNETINNSNNGFITYEIPNGQNQLFNSILVAEILENNINGQNPIGGQVFDFSQFTSDKILFGDVVSKNPLVEYNGMFGKLKFSINLSGVQNIIKDFVKNIAKSGAACFKKLNKNMSDDPYYGYEYAYSKADPKDNTESLNFVPNFIYQAHRDNRTIEPFLYPVEFDQEANDELLSFINDPNNYQQQILDTICPYQGGGEDEPPHKVYLDYNSLVEYFVTCMAFGLVDSVLKNMNIKTWTANSNLSNIAKWYIAFYDMDTCLGRDNKGIKTSYFAFTDYWKSNDLTINDQIIEAQRIKIYRDFYPAKLSIEEVSGYDIPSSYLFAIAKYAKYLIQTEYWEQNHFNTPQDLWTSWRQPGAILENAQSFMNKYFTNHLNKIPEALISYNYRFKYIWQTSTNSFDSNELNSFHGRGQYEVLDWLIKRFHILDAYFNLCSAKDYITYYDTDSKTWLNTNLTEIYPLNINEATNNSDIVIFKSLSAQDMTYTKTALSTMTFYVKAPELTPFVLYLKEGKYVYRYLLNDTNKTYKITINNAGNQDFFLGGSSEWTEFSGAHSLIENNILTCISNNLQVLSATEGTCSGWAFNLPALRTLILTSKKYSGNLVIGYSENNVSNLTNLSSINISNSSINLNINHSNIREIIANNINSESLIIRNSNNIKRIDLNNAFISKINIPSNVINLIDFTSLRFNNLEINSTELIDNSSIHIIDDKINPITTLKLEDIENITIQDVFQLRQLILSNTIVKKIVIINSDLNSLEQTYKENENSEIVNNSIYIEPIRIGSYIDKDGKEIIQYHKILHLEKLTNLKSLSLEGSTGFDTVILPNKDNIELLYRAFAETDLTHIDFADKANSNHTLILCDNENHDDCSIFYNSSFDLCSSYKDGTNIYLKFSVKEQNTSLKNLFALNKEYNSLGYHNGSPNISYNEAQQFINNLGYKQYVISLEKVFYRQTNIFVEYSDNEYYTDKTHNNKLNNKNHISLKGYVNLKSINGMFEYTQINFIDNIIFNQVDQEIENSETQLITIKPVAYNIDEIDILNAFPYDNLQYMHFDALNTIKDKIKEFIFDGDDEGRNRSSYKRSITIYNDSGIIGEVNVHNLLFNNKPSKLEKLSGFSISNKQNLNGLFTINEISITDIHNSFTNLNQTTNSNNLSDITDRFNLKSLTNLSTLYNSFIGIETSSIDNIDPNKTIDILNYLDLNNSKHRELFNKNNNIFNFYKNVDLTNITNWEHFWNNLSLSNITNINNLFSKCIFNVNDNQQNLEIPITYQGEDIDLSNIEEANNLFYQSSCFIVNNNGNNNIGITLSENTLKPLTGLTHANNMFNGCILNGINKYPLPEGLLSPLINLQYCQNMFANTTINGDYKTYKITDGPSKEIYYVKDLGSNPEVYNYEISSKSITTSTTTSDNGQINIINYGCPIIPPTLLSWCNDLENISGMFSNSDFEGYIHSDLLNNLGSLTNINNIFNNCKILPQLYKQFSATDDIDIYDKPNSTFNTYVFIPENFISSNNTKLKNIDIFNFKLLVSKSSKNRLYLFTNTSLFNKPLSNIQLSISDDSKIVNKWYYSKNSKTWDKSDPQIKPYDNINIGFINLCINKEEINNNTKYYEGINLDIWNNINANQCCLIEPYLASIYYGYIFKPGTLIKTLPDINIYFLKTKLTIYHPSGINDSINIEISPKIILPSIIYYTDMNENQIYLSNYYNGTLWDNLSNPYYISKLFSIEVNGLNIQNSQIDISCINQNLSTQYNLSDQQLEQLIYNNYYLLFNSYYKSYPFTQDGAILSPYGKFNIIRNDSIILLNNLILDNNSSEQRVLHYSYNVTGRFDNVNNRIIIENITAN